MIKVPKMSRIHFQYLADTIKDLEVSHETREYLAFKMSIALAKTNPHFNDARFITACTAK